MESASAKKDISGWQMKQWSIASMSHHSGIMGVVLMIVVRWWSWKEGLFASGGLLRWLGQDCGWGEPTAQWTSRSWKGAWVTLWLQQFIYQMWQRWTSSVYAQQDDFPGPERGHSFSLVHPNSGRRALWWQMLSSQWIWPPWNPERGFKKLKRHQEKMAKVINIYEINKRLFFV